MAYIILARKYRPQTFDEVIAQEHITRTLKNAIKTDHIAQAFLFTGPRGVGKTSMAHPCKGIELRKRTHRYTLQQMQELRGDHALELR